MLMYSYIFKCMFQTLKKITIENGNLAKILPIEWQSGPQSYALLLQDAPPQSANGFEFIIFCVMPCAA